MSEILEDIAYTERNMFINAKDFFDIFRRWSPHPQYLDSDHLAGVYLFGRLCLPIDGGYVVWHHCEWCGETAPPSNPKKGCNKCGGYI